MNPGGIETWLMHVLRHIDRERFRMDFLVHTRESCTYDDEVRALGSKIIPCLTPSQPSKYASNFQRVMREYGQYDVVHSHLHHYSGFVLWLAEQLGVKKRICHSHLDTATIDARANFLRQAYLLLMRELIARSATLGFAASGEAACSLFGSNWKLDPRWNILHCGIDLTPFQECVDRSALRASLGLRDDAFVIGHVGRFAPQKNHSLLVDIANEVCRRDPQVRFVLVGQGELRSEIERKVRQLSLQEKVLFVGVRKDVPHLMRSVFDIFILPSFHEGLPIVGVEAQAAGLKCIFADTITTELDVNPSLIQRLPINASSAKWSEYIFSARTNATDSERKAAMALITHSTFNIQAGIERLKAYYES